MNIENPQNQLKDLTERLITDIMCLVQLYPDFQETVYVEEVGDYPVYSRYLARKFRYSQERFPICEGMNPITYEYRQINLQEINIDWLVYVHDKLTSQLSTLPTRLKQYQFHCTQEDVIFLKKEEELYYYFIVNDRVYFNRVKEGNIKHTRPLVSTSNYSIKFECNATEGFCVFRGKDCLESFWSLRKALQYMAEIA